MILMELHNFYPKRTKILNFNLNFELLHRFLKSTSEIQITDSKDLKNENYYLNFIKEQELNVMNTCFVKLRSIPIETLGFVKTSFSNNYRLMN